jgi:hypothetical protein
MRYHCSIVLFICAFAARLCGGAKSAAGSYDYGSSSYRYPTFNTFDDDEVASSGDVAETTRSSIPLVPALKKLVVLGALSGGVYAGVRGFKFARRTLGTAYDSWKGRRAGTAAAKAAARAERAKESDMVTPSEPKLRSTNHIATAGYNATAIDEMKKEQEELWRFLHSLFKNQDEIIARLDKIPKDASPSDGSGVPDSAFRELSQQLESSLALLTARLDSLDAKFASVDDQLTTLSSSSQASRDVGAADIGSGVSVDEVRQLIKSETVELTEALLLLRKEVKMQMVKFLKEHDDTVVEKIKAFGEDMKKLVKSVSSAKGSSSSSGSGSSGGSKSSRP